MHLFLEGLLFGVVPVFFVGPVLFTLIHASLQSGFSAGAMVATGIAVSVRCPSSSVTPRRGGGGGAPKMRRRLERGRC